MSLIGNNNKKPAAEALKREADGRGWLSGNMAQIMVLLNGLILTFTAYFTLSVFMKQIVDDNLSALTYETREHLNERISNLEKSILSASQIVSFSWKLDTNDILNNFSQAFTYESYYDQLFWLESTGNGEYLAHTLFKNSPGARNTDFSRVHKYVISSLQDTKSEINVLNDYAAYAPEAQPPQSNKPLLLARAFRRDGRMDIVYGISGINRILSPEFFGNRKSIQELSVEFRDSSQSLYRYMRFDLPEGGRDLKNSVKKRFDIMLGDQMVRLDIWVALGEHEQFLKKIPFLMLLFGATLTMIGTMYVRNNQKQSLRLATVNLELGQKNADLNREVEEREKLNETLRRQEKENRAVIDAVSDIIFETATDGNLLFLNETWQKITGFSAERSLGRNLFDLLHMQDQAEQRSNFSLLVKGKKPAYRAFTRLRTAEGTFRAIELAFSMIRQDENKDLRVVGTITDVEERRRAERALSEAEKKYRAIVENAAAGIYQVTPEGHYLSANPAMAHILGFGSADEILRDVRNANTDIYYNGRERERQLRDAVRSGSINTEAQVRRKDGRLIWVQESLRAVKDDDDQLIFFEGSMEDITQRKETEIALREAKVESDLANRAKSEFLANMSHELRTPLNAIIGFSEIIRTQAFGSVGAPEYLDYARDINESGKRLLQVINDILDVSRIEAGERQLNEGVVDLYKILVSSLEMLAPKIEANRMVISNHVRDTVPKLIGESHAIKQMLINLLSNAVKFTPEGGRISIDADVDEYGQMHVSVTDTGIGLSDEEIEKALSPFGQVDSGLSRNESGTGLGLTLVQSLMALHGGSFELFSQKGIGTTATLVFPPRRVSHQGAQQPVDA
jgi:PAS domain S-box-containing protein